VAQPLPQVAQPPPQVAQPPRAAAPPARAAPPAPPVVDDDDGLLFDYGAPDPSPALAPHATAAASPSKKKKGKGGGQDAFPEPLGGGEDEDSLGLGSENMPPAMSTWCEEQMLALTGSDDTTLSHFLFSLQNDDEIQSYLSMYLGSSEAVNTFAREFTLRKRAARGIGESRDFQTVGRSGKAAAADDWEPSKAGKKKGKGKKAVDPSLLGFSVESSRIMQGELQFVEGM